MKRNKFRAGKNTVKPKMPNRIKSPKGPDSDSFFSSLLLLEFRIGFPKTFFHSKIVREGETLPHEGQLVIFGVLFPKKI